jgi:hypothetical protein
LLDPVNGNPFLSAWDPMRGGRMGIGFTNAAGEYKLFSL